MKRKLPRFQYKKAKSYKDYVNADKELSAEDKAFWIDVHKRGSFRCAEGRPLEVKTNKTKLIPYEPNYNSFRKHRAIN
jgi:hypothetical protein